MSYFWHFEAVSGHSGARQASNVVPAVKKCGQIVPPS